MKTEPPITGLAEIVMAGQEPTVLPATLEWEDGAGLVLRTAWYEDGGWRHMSASPATDLASCSINSWALESPMVRRWSKSVNGQRIDIEIVARRATRTHGAETEEAAVGAESRGWSVEFDEPADWRLRAGGPALFDGVVCNDNAVPSALLDLAFQHLPDGLKSSRVRLYEYSTRSVSRVSERSTTDLRLTVSLQDAIGWETFHRAYLTPATDLLSFALGQPVKVRHVAQRRGDDELWRRHLSQTYQAPSSEQAHQNRRPIDFGSFLASPSLLGRWWTLHAKVGHQLTIFVSQLSAKRVPTTPGSFLLALGFVDGFSEHVRRDPGRGIADRMRRALDRLSADFGASPANWHSDAWARDLVTTRNYLMHWDKDQEQTRRDYGERHSLNLAVYRDLLVASAYRDLLDELGVEDGAERARIVRGASRFAEDVLRD